MSSRSEFPNRDDGRSPCPKSEGVHAPASQLVQVWSAQNRYPVASSGRDAHRRSDPLGNTRVRGRDRTFRERRGVPRSGSAVDASARGRGLHLRSGGTHPGCRSHFQPAAIPLHTRLDPGCVLRGDLPRECCSVRERDGRIRTRFGCFAIHTAALPTRARCVGLVVHLCVVTLAGWQQRISKMSR